MPYRDLREFISLLEREGEITRVKAEVDPELELALIVRKVFDRRGKALLFENVKGHDIPLISGAVDTYKRYGLGIGAEPDPSSILDKTISSSRNPIPPVSVNEGPCQEVVNTGKKVDLNVLPVPKWHELDGGKFIGTLGLVIVKDPDTGARNMGIYRQQIHGKDRMGLLATQQVGLVLRKYRDRGQPMPVATVIGVDPAILAASCFRLPPGGDELAVAGAMKGEPIPLVKCKTIDVEVPAYAEIVIEGEIPPDSGKWDVGGPFGEFTGFYGGVVTKKPSIYVKAITTRTDPIFQGTLEGMPPSESTTLRCLGHTTGTHIRLEQARIPGFKRVWVTEMGCANFVVVIQLEKQYYLGNARQAIMAYWSMEHVGKWCIVVDDDIDIFDMAQVEWALATRVQPHRDIIITADRDPGTNLDPSIPPEKRPYPYTQCSRIGIDATKDFKGFDFPPEIRSRPEDLKKVEDRWPEYGID